MVKRNQAFFFCSPEMGARLRQLRYRAGLNLRDLAHIMGRSPGHTQRLSRLESGKLKHPTLGLVADYLRACRASFNDILVPLARYTNLPRVREKPDRAIALSGLTGDRSRDAERLSIYDRKTADARKAAGQKPVPARKRARALARQVKSAREQRQLSRVIESAVNELRARPTLMVRKLALDYGRMVWKALEMTEADSSQKPKAKTQKPKPANGSKNHRDTERTEYGADRSKDSGRKLRRQKEGGDKDRRFFGEPQNDRQGTAVRRGPGRPRKTREERLRDAEARARALGPGVLSGRAYRELQAQVVRLFELVYRRAGPPG